MKLNKKVLGLVLAGILTVGMVGCGDTKIESEEETTVKQEQQVENESKDEDVTKDYQAEEKEDSDLLAKIDEAYEILTPVMEESFEGSLYDFEKSEYGLRLVLYLPSDEVAKGIYNGQWNDFVIKVTDLSEQMDYILGTAGYEDVAFSVFVCDSEKGQDACYLGVNDGVVVYNVADSIKNN